MKNIKVVYDYDDVLWGLNQRAYANLGIPLEKNIDFAVSDNHRLTKLEKQSLLRAYSNSQTFLNINFFDYLEEILKVEELGATVYINSNCYTREILELKQAQLRQALPQFNPEHIRLNLIVNGNAKHKPIDQDTTILVDDSPYNIASSEAEYNIFPEYPWNTTTKAKNQVKDKNVFWRPNLHEINQLVYQTAKTLLRNSPES